MSKGSKDTEETIEGLDPTSKQQFQKSRSSKSLISVNQFTPTKDSKQLGSNPGGTYTLNGETYYLKFPAQKGDPKKGNALAKNEILAAKLYQLGGIAVPDIFLIQDAQGNLGVASKIEHTFKSAENPDKSQPRENIDWSKLPGVAKGLAFDAWLCNNDAVGLYYDNIGTYTNPKNSQIEAFRVDTGGALGYRAQGELKGERFGDDATIELITLLRLNDQAAKIFKDVDIKQIEEGVEAIAAIKDQDIVELVEQYGPDDPKEREMLTDKLLARKVTLMEEYGLAPSSKLEYAYSPLKKTTETKILEEIIADLIDDSSKVVFSNSKESNLDTGEKTIMVTYRGSTRDFTDLLSKANFTHLSFSSDIIAQYRQQNFPDTNANQHTYKQFKNDIYKAFKTKFPPFEENTQQDQIKRINEQIEKLFAITNDLDSEELNHLQKLLPENLTEDEKRKFQALEALQKEKHELEEKLDILQLDRHC